MKKILLFLALIGLSIIRTASAQVVTPTINGTPPPFTFTGAVTQTGQNFNFTLGPVINATDPLYGCVGNNSTSNNSCWSALAAAANAATNPVTIYFPPGTYLWSTTPSFTQPVTILCDNPAGTTFNYSGTGNEITFADIGTSSGTTFDFAPYQVLNCGHIGGASAAYGIYGGLNHWKIEISGNLWYDWGSTTNFAIYCKGNNECIAHDNKYWQDTGTATNWLYAPDAGTAGWGAANIYGNDLNCVANVSGGGAPTQGSCGIGIWTATTTGTEIHDNPFISGFNAGIRVQTSSPQPSVSVHDNYIETNSSTFGVEFGSPSGSNETVGSLLAYHNRFYLPTGAQAFGPANSTTILTNSSFTSNFYRPDSTSLAPMVSLNNIVGQTGNLFAFNQNFPSIHSVGSNIAAWQTPSMIYDTVTVSAGRTYNGTTNYTSFPNLSSVGNYSVAFNYCMTSAASSLVSAAAADNYPTTPRNDWIYSAQNTSNQAQWAAVVAGTGNTSSANSFTQPSVRTCPADTHHVAITRSGTTVTTYVDGTSVGGTTTVGTGTFTMTDIVVGGHYYSSAINEQFAGTVAEFAVWNGYVLSTSDISNLANQYILASSIAPTYLSIYAPLGSTCPEPDLSGNGNVGTCH